MRTERMSSWSGLWCQCLPHPMGQLWHKSILNFIILNRLNICNVENTPTFRNHFTETVIDITLSSMNKCMIRDWRVSEECSFFDQKLIALSINLSGHLYIHAPDFLVRFIIHILGNRLIRSNLGGCSTVKHATRGTPQRAVLSPLLWRLITNVHCIVHWVNSISGYRTCLLTSTRPLI